MSRLSDRSSTRRSLAPEREAGTGPVSQLCDACSTWMDEGRAGMVPVA